MPFCFPCCRLFMISTDDGIACTRNSWRRQTLNGRWDGRVEATYQYMYMSLKSEIDSQFWSLSIFLTVLNADEIRKSYCILITKITHIVGPRKYNRYYGSTPYTIKTAVSLWQYGVRSRSKRFRILRHTYLSKKNGERMDIQEDILSRRFFLAVFF